MCDRKWLNKGSGFEEWPFSSCQAEKKYSRNISTTIDWTLVIRLKYDSYAEEEFMVIVDVKLHRHDM